MTFAEILDAAERLEPEDQAELVSVISRRLAEQGRERVARTVEQAKKEHAAGHCCVMSASEILREAQS